MRRYFNSILSFVIVISIFLSYSITACAVPKRLKDGTWVDVPWSEYGEEIGYLLQYAFSTMGVILNGELEQWIKNNETYKDLYDENGRLAKHTSVDPEKETVSYDKEIMIVLKALIDDYAAENQPFVVEKTYRMSQIPASAFANKPAYDMFKSYFAASYAYVICNPQGSYGYIGDLTPYIKEGGGFYKSGSNYMNVLKADWAICHTPVNRYFCKNDTNGNAYVEIEENYTTQSSIQRYDPNKTNFNAYPQNMFLVTSDGGNIRVFNTMADLINYSVGQRKIYYTSNYYDYVPDDLSVSIDDLQKTIDDMQDVIDKLLDQITNDTSESEIEELLKKILEELQKNPGGSGSGSGGDVNVDIDLSTTNSWLSKIYAKVSQIFDKISETASNTSDAVHAKIQESLDEIVEQLKKLKRWTAVDTVIDGVDAIGDWLGLLKDIVTDAESGVGSAVSAVSSALGETVDLASKKFPFSIPWDILFFVSVMSSEPQMPQFEIPITFDISMLDMHVDYKLELDFEPFQWLSDLFRLILSLTYAVGLLKMTFRVTSAGKEE